MARKRPGRRAGPASTQGASVFDRCDFRGRLALAAVVVCPPGLTPDELKAVGRRACGNAVYCNAWMWDDPAKAPATPPTPELPMTDEQADSAIAVYIAKSGELNLHKGGGQPLGA